MTAQINTPQNTAVSAKNPAKNWLGYRLLLFDSALEILTGMGLIVAMNPVGEWLGISAWLVALGGFIFMDVGLVFLYLTRKGAEGALVRIAGGLNIIGGVIVWGLLALVWNEIAVEGRWLLGGLGDAFLLLGAAQWWAARQR